MTENQTLTHKELWENCLREVEENLSKTNFSTWFKNTYILKEDGGMIYISVPNEFVKDWLNNKYHKLILRILTGYTETLRGVEYIVTKYDPKPKEVEVLRAPTPVKELPLSDLYINKEDNLNPRYVFDTFIVGSFNELAYAASQAIVLKPGVAYNPFFVYGGTGLGKTHLIQAIGNALKAKSPDKKFHYTTLEKFSTDFVNSMQNNKINSFREKYRRYDTIIIDDIQFIGTKEKTQDELFHLFNSFYENNKQIIFSSDKHPNFIPNLEERLKSRFSSGMIVDISEPEYESRVAILKSKCKDQSIVIGDDILSYVASVIPGNVRELEGSLNAIVCQVQLKNRELSLAEVKGLIKNNIKPKKNVSIKEMVKIVSDFYNIEEAQIYEKIRRKEIVRARQVIMYILREDFNVSYPLIGAKLGGKDHTTVIHSCLKIKADLKNDPILVEELDRIRIMFK